MKKLLFAIAAICLIYSCNESKTLSANEDNSQAERNAQNSREIYKALETGDVSRLDSFIAEDILDHNGNDRWEDIRGRDSVKHYISQVHKYFDGLKMTVVSEGTSSDGNYHFAMVRMQGKSKENPWGMPVGVDVDDTGVDVTKIKDGKAVEHWGFMSHGDIKEMMSGMSGGQTTTTDTTNQKR